MQFKYVVRTIGERTEELCLDFIRQQQSPDESITIIREPTHAGAVEKTILSGMESQADWLVAIDADILFFPDGMSLIKKQIHTCKNPPAVVYPAVFDKQWGMCRWAGIQVYNTSMIELVYELFQEARRRNTLKVEGATISLLRERGEDVLFSRLPLALHDFHQYYRDLYRKVYLNTIRNPGMNKRARKYWKMNQHTDADFRVMISAQGAAYAGVRSVTNSVQDFEATELEDIIRSLDLEEKTPLTMSQYSQTAIADYMQSRKHCIRKNRYVKDFFEDQSAKARMSVLLRQHAPYLAAGAKKIANLVK